MQVIGVDTGGTFTDAVVLTGDGTLAVAKALSTAGQVEAGVLAALELLAADLDVPLPDLLHGTDVLAHGTTVGLNALLTGDGARVGLVTTAGFEATLAIAKANKVHGLDDEDLRRPVRWDKPRRLVPADRVVGVRERVDRAGTVLGALEDDDVRARLRTLADRGVESLAVALLWSATDPRHEERVAELAAEVLPGVPVSLSSRLAPRLGEYERTCTAVLDAYVAPLISSYLSRLQEELAHRGFRGRLLVTRMSGGVQAVQAALRAPVQTLRSGPAGGLAATARVGAELGHADVVATDVGGTSFDVGLVLGGEPARLQRPMIDRFPLAVPIVDITSIGTGGGSIAWVDEALGALRVGPRSAGADPGPVCYARGGRAPTVTDAAAVLGWIDRLGGTLSLDVAAAEAAIQREVAEPLGLSVHQAAEGVVAIACEQMTDLVRRSTVERGHDPADFALYAYGGAAPQYVGRYAAGLGVRDVVVPAFAAQFSAFGAVASDIRASAEQDVPPAPLAEVLPAVAQALARLTAAVREELAGGGLGGEGARLRRTVGLRFYRQLERIDVPVQGPDVGPGEVPGLLAEFRRRYEQVVGPGSARADTPVEVVAVAAEAVLPSGLPELPRRSGAPAAPVRTRTAWFGGRPVPCPVLAWDSLAAGQRVTGPAFVESASTTLVVHPGQAAVAEPAGHLRLLLGAAA